MYTAMVLLLLCLNFKSTPSFAFYDLLLRVCLSEGHPKSIVTKVHCLTGIVVSKRVYMSFSRCTRYVRCEMFDGVKRCRTNVCLYFERWFIVEQDVTTCTFIAKNSWWDVLFWCESHCGLFDSHKTTCFCFMMCF